MVLHQCGKVSLDFLADCVVKTEQTDFNRCGIMKEISEENYGK